MTRWELARMDLGPAVVFFAGFLCGMFGLGLFCH